jgi:hypothetical protein
VTELGAAATDTLRVRERPACVRACVPRSVVRMRHVSTRIPPPGPDALVGVECRIVSLGHCPARHRADRYTETWTDEQESAAELECIYLS